MATRYLPASPFACRDKRGLRLVFNSDYINRADGLPGYTEDQIKHLDKSMLASFRAFEVEGGPKSVPVEAADEVVETATSEPGVKRAVKTPKK